MVIANGFRHFKLSIQLLSYPMTLTSLILIHPYIHDGHDDLSLKAKNIGFQ